ncbi:Allene oxide synthase [Hibiscus syriacus]|uniref:Allene oxide synthase n=1 Tax=Hibiscus syriacus TaxID=106335 RepID=A0A6A3CNL3_HIBSY|nr:allene oxide synthase 1, chloroplastic-like [Hibiscus syriacus]KAE8729202.1 Allene oxide synthase [Hibiscus syriacus]
MAFPISDLPTEIRAVVAPQSVTVCEPGETRLPLNQIPGDYGLPFIGAIKDRLDFFYNEGRDEFFKSKIQKYQSTVIRTNMPPGPFIASNPKVIALLDGKSFPVLLDVSKVEKRDVLTGTYMPSRDLTGGYRMLAYLDPSEPKHASLKQLIFFLLKSSRDKVLPQFESCYAELFETVEKEVGEKGKSSFEPPNEQAAFKFLSLAFFGSNPADTKLGVDGPSLVNKWLLFQLHPILSLGLPKYIDDILLHTFPLPAFLVKKDYKRLYDFFYESSGFVQDEAEKMGISREEACHNLLFTACFNSFAGIKVFFPIMVKWIGRGGGKLHTELAQEIRSVIKLNGGKLSMAIMEQMPLVKSVVYEALRIEPPVPYMYGKAKKDLLIESHAAVYEVKEGEMLFGYQPFATKDPKIFERAEEFVPDRFKGEDGEKLLKYLLWSNGPETEHTTAANKQCAGKDLVVLVSRLFVVELFRRYDTFEIELGEASLGAAVTIITSLKRGSFERE